MRKTRGPVPVRRFAPHHPARCIQRYAVLRGCTRGRGCPGLRRKRTYVVEFHVIETSGYARMSRPVSVAATDAVIRKPVRGRYVHRGLLVEYKVMPRRAIERARNG